MIDDPNGAASESNSASEPPERPDGGTNVPKETPASATDEPDASVVVRSGGDGKAGAAPPKTPDSAEAAPRSVTITKLWSKLTKSALAALLVFPIFTAFIGGYAVYLIERNTEQSDKQKEADEKQRLEEEAAANPLIVAVADPLKAMPPQYDFMLVVTDVDALKLGPEPPPAESCPRLFDAAVTAGGKAPTSERYNVTVTGNTEQTVAIVGMRAIAENHRQPSNGALAGCLTRMGNGPVQPSEFAFDLRNSDRADAVLMADNRPAQKQFQDNFQLHVPHNDSVPFTIGVQLPADSVDWHIEADVEVGGNRQTIEINDPSTKQDFHSPGLRTDGYDQTYFGMFGFVLPDTWTTGKLPGFTPGSVIQSLQPPPPEPGAAGPTSQIPSVSAPPTPTR